MKITRKYILTLCLMLCITLLLASCVDSGSDTSDSISASNSSETINVSDESSKQDVESLFEFERAIGREGYTVKTYLEKEGLTDIEIPAYVNGLPVVDTYNAFYRCNDLISVTFPNTLMHISMYTFDGCKRLSYIDIPSSKTIVNAGAFVNCSNIKRINFGGTKAQWESFNCTWSLPVGAIVHCADGDIMVE